MSGSNPQLQRALAQALETLHRAGVQQIPRLEPERLHALRESAESTQTPPPLEAPHVERPAEPEMPKRRPTSAPAPEQRAPAAPAPTESLIQERPWQAPLPTDQREPQLAVLQAEVAACTACGELASTRTQTVFGVGTANPRVCFFGEAPGADEDRQGEPFVGRAGQLLTQIIQACGWRREEVYILNTLKCRPPGNRNPAPEEVSNCRHFWERQLEILRPEFVVCLGAYATQAILDTKISVGKLRGQFHPYRDLRVLVTYHPSYLLRNPSAKKLVWEDMKLLLAEMGLPIPQRGK